MSFGFEEIKEYIERMVKAENTVENVKHAFDVLNRELEKSPSPKGKCEVFKVYIVAMKEILREVKK